ncbi:hypothetical protein FKM82_022610 [Ascaphus truei]
MYLQHMTDLWTRSNIRNVPNIINYRGVNGNIIFKDFNIAQVCMRIGTRLQETRQSIPIHRQHFTKRTDTTIPAKTRRGVKEQRHESLQWEIW